jgi:hypothetical protein
MAIAAAPRTAPTVRPTTLGKVQPGQTFRINGAWHVAGEWKDGEFTHTNPAGITVTTPCNPGRATTVKLTA